MKTLAAIWTSYQEHVIRRKPVPDCQEAYERMLRYSFYAGATALLTLLDDAYCQDDIAGVAEIVRVRQELRQHIEMVREAQVAQMVEKLRGQ